MARMSEKDDVRLVKCQHFEQCYHRTGTNKRCFNRHFEIGLQHNRREYAHALHSQEEEVRLHPDVVEASVEEHPARYPVGCRLKQHVGKIDKRKDAYHLILVDDEGVGYAYLYVEEENQCEEQGHEADEEP